MQIDSYVQAVSEDLARVAAVGDESTARAAELLAVAIESSLALRLQEAMAEAALELSGQLDQGRVEVRVSGGGRNSSTFATRGRWQAKAPMRPPPPPVALTRQGGALGAFQTQVARADYSTEDRVRSTEKGRTRLR